MFWFFSLRSFLPLAVSVENVTTSMIKEIIVKIECHSDLRGFDGNNLLIFQFKCLKHKLTNKQHQESVRKSNVTSFRNNSIWTLFLFEFQKLIQFIFCVIAWLLKMKPKGTVSNSPAGKRTPKSRRRRGKGNQKNKKNVVRLKIWRQSK